MHDDENHSRARRRAAMLAATAGIALLTVACGSPTSSASGSSSSSAGPGSSADAAGSQMVAFAQCMRAHGVTDYPDSGAVLGATPGSDLNPGNPTYQAAKKACEHLHPQVHLNQAQAAQNQAEALKYSKCMRQHGITNYPDPGSHSINLSGVDRYSPQFQAAQQACRKYQNPNGKG